METCLKKNSPPAKIFCYFRYETRNNKDFPLHEEYSKVDISSSRPVFFLKNSSGYFKKKFSTLYI